MPQATLVESIPWGMDDLRGVEGVAYTEDVLLRLVAAAERSIDLTAMYWSLVPDPHRPDEADFSPEQLRALGAEHGRQLHQALEDAARRNVHIRVLQSPGFGDGPQESDRLALKYPDTFLVRPVEMQAWYGAGIMHQKLWLFDQKQLYLGSANMDWRSLTQVKELGIVLENHPELAADLGRYFDAWWHFAGLEPTTAWAWDPAVGIERRVPNWSTLLPEGERHPSPLDRPEWRATTSRPEPAPLWLDAKFGTAFLTGSPPELCAPGRTTDLDGLLHTIRDAGDSLCASVMTYSSISRYSGGKRDGDDDGDGEGEAIWWPILNDALLRAAITGQVHVRLLVSRWDHISSQVLTALRSLQLAGEAARGDEEAGGRLEIKLFTVPGWNRTTAESDRLYPNHSRVNHPKYLVTDRRLYLSTSNMSWGYHASSAGCSLSTDQPGLVSKAQELFDRDWDSNYAQPLIG